MKRQGQEILEQHASKTKGTVVAELIEAISNNKTERAKQLIIQTDQQALKDPDSYGWTALHMAAEFDNQEIYKMLIINMHIKEVAALTTSNHPIAISSMASLNVKAPYSQIQMMAARMIAGFINEKFCNEEYPADFDNYQIKLLKLYPTINYLLVGFQLFLLQQEKGKENIILSKINNYIATHYFELIGVCKSIDANNPLLTLATNNDCMTIVLSCLKPYTLLPDLFSSVLLGEEAATITEI